MTSDFLLRETASLPTSNRIDNKRFLTSKPVGLFVLSVYTVGVAAETGLIKGDGHDHGIPVPPTLSLINSTTTSGASYAVGIDTITGDWKVIGPSIKGEPLFTHGGGKRFDSA